MGHLDVAQDLGVVCFFMLLIFKNFHDLLLKNF